MKISLSQSEWRIANLLWKKSPRTITQLTAALKDETGWTKHTVISYLARMEAKGAIRYEEGARAKLYYPAIDQNEAVLSETEEFLGRVFDGRMGLMVSTMIENRALSREDIAELYDIIAKAEKAKAGADGGR